MAKLTLLCTLLAFGIQTSDARSQHMFCNTVEDVLSGEGSQQSIAHPKILKGPVGKMGPRGEKGAAGAPGLTGIPGTVNQRDLETVVKETVNAATAILREEMEKLKRDVEALNATGVIAVEVPKTTPETRIDAALCSHGFTYDGNCYFTVIVNAGRSSVDLTRAKQLCIDRGARIADVTNLEHEFMVQEEMQKSLKIFYLQIWLAMTYRPSASTLHLSNGTTMNVGLFRWYDDRFPSSKRSDTNLIIEAREARGSRGMFNRFPSFETHGALCVN